LRALPLRGPMRTSGSRGLPRPREPPDPEAVASRRRRAAEEPLDVRLLAREPFVELEVRNPVHRTSYRVLFPEYPGRDGAFCGCTDFARRGLGTCKHVEAGWSWLGSLPRLPDVPPAPPRGRPSTEVWSEVDRALAERAGRPVQRIRELERVGASLFEEPVGSPGKKEEGGETVGRRRSDRTPTSTSRAHP